MYPHNFRHWVEIGHGAFGTVFSAEVVDRQRIATEKVAIKRIDLPNDVRHADERQILVALKHPNIISYWGSFFDADDRLCIVTEYAMGGDLGAFLSQYRNGEGAVPEADCWSILLGLLLGLNYMHQQHIIHRDIKPENILLHRNVTSEGAQTSRIRIEDVKIADVGLARWMPDDDLWNMQTKGLAGTPRYLSPEQCHGQHYNQKTDVWSAGCVLHELLTGKFAFEGSNLVVLIAHICAEGEVQLNASHCPSKELRFICSSMLRKRSEARPSAASLLQFHAIRSRIEYEQETMGTTKVSMDDTSGGETHGNTLERLQRQLAQVHEQEIAYLRTLYRMEYENQVVEAQITWTEEQIAQFIQKSPPTDT